MLLERAAKHFLSVGGFTLFTVWKLYAGVKVFCFVAHVKLGFDRQKSDAAGTTTKVLGQYSPKVLYLRFKGRLEDNLCKDVHKTKYLDQSKRC